MRTLVYVLTRRERVVPTYAFCKIRRSSQTKYFIKSYTGILSKINNFNTIKNDGNRDFDAQ